MYLFFLVASLVSISVAAGAAFMVDIFFLMSLRHRKILVKEVEKFQSLNSMGLIATIFAGISEIVLISLQINDGLALSEYSMYAIVILMLVAFTCTLTLRGIHLPALRRHQHDHAHLSDSFIVHHESLIGTCAISSVTWLFIITLIGAQNDNVNISFHFGTFMLTYIIVAYVASKSFMYLKRYVK